MNGNKPNIEIRLASPDDALAISSVLAKAFAEYKALYTKEGLAATTPPSEVLKARFCEGQTWIVLIDDEIVGTVSVVPKGNDLYIRSMAILPKARGNKIGETLLKQIEDFAFANGYKCLTLNTTPFLDRAIRLYEKFGFVRNGFDDLYRTPLIKMVKSLETTERLIDEN